MVNTHNIPRTWNLCLLIVSTVLEPACQILTCAAYVAIFTLSVSSGTASAYTFIQFVLWAVLCLIHVVYEAISWKRALLAEEDEEDFEDGKVFSLLWKADDHRDGLKIFCQSFVWGAVLSALIVYAAFYFGIEQPFTNAKKST